MNKQMSAMNKRLDDLIVQVREMDLSTNELVVVQVRHGREAHKSRTSALVHAAATIVLMERTFANPQVNELWVEPIKVKD